MPIEDFLGSTVVAKIADTGDRDCTADTDSETSDDLLVEYLFGPCPNPNGSDDLARNDEIRPPTPVLY